MTGEPVPKVLIIEDEAIVAADARQILERAGCQTVGIARDTVSALQLAEDTPPDVALVDVNLVGEIDGVSAARELNQRYGTQVIFATGFGDDVVRDGFDLEYQLIAKPFFEADLMETLAKVRFNLG